MQFTQNSQALRSGLAAGDFDIAHAAVDNAVAMRESTGAAQLRGQTPIVDAPNTAYALQAKQVLLDAGRKADRSNTVSTLNPPFSFQARDAGLRSLGRNVDLRRYDAALATLPR